MATLKQQSDFTGKFIEDSEKAIPRNIYKQNNAYYEGDNTAIMMKADKKKPDNRVPVPFVNRLIKNLMGYASRTGDIVTNPTTDDNGDLDETFKKVFELTESKNSVDLLNTKLYKSTLKHGISYELIWTETDPNNKSSFILKDADIPVSECFPVWDTTLSTVPKLASFIRYYERNMPQTITVDNKQIELKAGKYANVYLKGGYEIWKYEESDNKAIGNGNNIFKGIVPNKVDTGAVPFTSKGNKLSSSIDNGKVSFVAFIDQPFEELQVVAYQANDEMIPYWKPVKKIIDEYDKIISSNMNEADRFNDTWLMFLQKIDAKTKASIDEMGVIHSLRDSIQEGISDVWPRFLERKIPVEHAKLMLDTLETLIYTIIGVPSFLSETFNQASGVALLFRLIGLEYAAVEVDTYFNLGLMQRLELYKQAMASGLNFYGEGVISKIAIENITADIKHTRNLPMDLTTILDQALQLKALGLSDKIVLSLLPSQIVPDIEAELLLIEKKKKENEAITQSLLTDDTDDNEDDIA